jgi:hypothetical protein
MTKQGQRFGNSESDLDLPFSCTFLAWELSASVGERYHGFGSALRSRRPKLA